MKTICQERRNLELALDRFNWAAAKGGDPIAGPSAGVGLAQLEERSIPAKGVHTEVKHAKNKATASCPPRKHQLELIPPRKRLKQCGTGNASSSPFKTANNLASKVNTSPKKQKGGGGGDRDPAGGAGPSRNAASGGAGGNSDDEGEDDLFDPTEDEAPKLVDSQCAQCDDGGFLIECIGRCRRVFHVGIEPEEEAGGSAAFDSDDEEENRKKDDDKSYTIIECNVINMAEDLAIALATSSSQLVCPSCLTYEQQCSSCGKFDEEGTKVRPCLVASCGHFYHPACMKEEKKNLGLNHAARSLKEMCPLHWCCKCKMQGDGGSGVSVGSQEQDAGDQSNELVKCRRCPVAYHRRCIPSSWNGFEGQPQRAWMADFDSDGHLLPGCIVETSMLYCGKHELDDTGVAKHAVPLFSTDILKAWALHYAKEFPHLESSKKLLVEKGVLGLVRESPGFSPGGGALGINNSSTVKRHSLEDNSALDEPIFQSIRALDASAMRATTEIDAVLDARRMLNEAKNQIDIASVKSGMVQPYPYRNRSKNTIDRGVLANIEATMHYVDQNTASEGTTLTTLIRQADIEAIDESYRFLSYYMSPYIYPASYYSFGRIFMKNDLIKHVVGHLSHLLRNGDCIVDLNCGKNEFVPLVKEVARKDGIIVTGRSFDVIVPKDLGNYVRKPWKAVTPESDDLRDGDRLVIGVKPPHGKGIRLSNAFIDHIASFSPRIMALVVPLESMVPRGYTAIVEDRNICNARDSFYDPSTNRSLLQAEAGDHVFRVLVRSDLKHSVFELNGNGGEKCWEEVPVPGQR